MSTFWYNTNKKLELVFMTTHTTRQSRSGKSGEDKGQVASSTMIVVQVYQYGGYLSRQLRHVIVIHRIDTKC